MRWTALAACLCALLGCEEPVPQAGEAGGPCRISTSAPCDEGLACLTGGCRRPPAPGEGADGGALVPPLDVAFVLEKERVRADGHDRVVLEFHVFVRETGAPYLGEVAVTLEPESAGAVDFPRVELTETERPDGRTSGRGLTRMTACDARLRACPPAFVFKISTVQDPLSTVAASPKVRLDSSDVITDAGEILPDPVDAGEAPPPDAAPPPAAPPPDATPPDAAG